MKFYLALALVLLLETEVTSTRGHGSCPTYVSYTYTTSRGTVRSRKSDACHSTTTSHDIGTNSCTGAQSCWSTIDTSIGHDSCSSYRSCEHVSLSTDDDDEDSGDKKKFEIGNDACTGYQSCYSNKANIGNNACTLDYVDTGSNDEDTNESSCFLYKGICGDVPHNCPSIGAWINGDCGDSWCLPATSCHGHAACNAVNKRTDIGRKSCNGYKACENVGLYMGKAAFWDGERVVGKQGQRVTIGHMSCQGPKSCNLLQGSVDSGSCQGVDSCRNNSGEMGPDSCIGRKSCYGVRVSVGKGSCIGVESCRGITGATIGSNSCIDDGSCRRYDGEFGDIPDNCPSIDALMNGQCSEDI